ncbi:MAG: hypothetical protein MJ180_06480, partial [Candidatus Gastranaerophilales bacterium]|nr:hypothetical protein [Candidatus Gastranaerophilales bacterium]
AVYDPVTGLKGNIAEKQYEVINPDGSRSPLVVSELKPGQVATIIKKEGVELKMAVFDEPTTSLEGETLPAGKLMMIDSEGHPYNGNPVKRLRSGEIEMAFDKSAPAQAKMSDDLAKIKDLDAQTKAAKKAGNKDLAGQLKSQADALAKELDTQLTEFVKENQVAKIAQPIVETSTNKEGAFVTTNPDGTRTESLYNNKGKFLSQKTEFDASGHKTKTLTISESGVKTTTTYDINENVTSQEEYFPKTQASDEVTRHTSYKNGEITEIVVRDKFYNPVSIAVKNPDGSVTKTTFKKDGSPLETTIPADKVASNPDILKPATPIEITAVQSAKSFTPMQLDALKKVGFTQSVIEALKKDSDIAEFYGQKLLDDTLDMVLYLESMTRQGQKITRDSLHAAILECSPGSSGGSSSVMLRLIANNWNRGVEIYNALGEKAPANIVQRAETAKLQQKLIKNLSGDDYAKHWSLEDLAKGIETIENHPEIVETLANAKASNGKPLFSLDEIDDAILNCRKTIEKSPEIITAILSNSEEVKIISEWNNKAAGLWKATNDPLASTLKANPKAFGIETKAKVTKSDLIAALDKVHYDKAYAKQLIETHPEMVETLIAATDANGNPLFSALDIDDILYNCQQNISKNPQSIINVLKDPKLVADITSEKNKAVALWILVRDNI